MSLTLDATGSDSTHSGYQAITSGYQDSDYYPGLVYCSQRRPGLQVNGPSESNTTTRLSLLGCTAAGAVVTPAHTFKLAHSESIFHSLASPREVTGPSSARSLVASHCCTAGKDMIMIPTRRMYGTQR